MAAAIARMPEPVPISSSLSPGRMQSSSAAMHSCVVSWLPVPNEEAGSISRMRRPCVSSTVSHEGLIRKVLPTGKGLKYCFQPHSQSSWRVSAVSVHRRPHSCPVSYTHLDVYKRQVVPNRHPFNSVSHAENPRGIGLVDMVYALHNHRAPRASGDMALHALEVMACILRPAHEHVFLEPETTFERPAPLPLDFPASEQA